MAFPTAAPAESEVRKQNDRNRDRSTLHEMRRSHVPKGAARRGRAHGGQHRNPGRIASGRRRSLLQVSEVRGEEFGGDGYEPDGSSAAAVHTCEAINPGISPGWRYGVVSRIMATEILLAASSRASTPTIEFFSCKANISCECVWCPGGGGRHGKKDRARTAWRA